MRADMCIQWEVGAEWRRNRSGRSTGRGAHQHGDGLQVDLAAVLVDAVQAAQVLPPHLQQLLRLVTSKGFCLKLRSTSGWLIGASSHSNRLTSCA